MKLAKSLLKSLFSTGKKPTQQNYADWMDSFVHLDDQAAVDGQIVSQLLVAYDQAQKTTNQNGQVDTLGDVFRIMEGLDDSVKLTTLLSAYKWSTLPGKPATVPLILTEQFIDTSVTKFDPQPRTVQLPSTTLTNPATSGLLAIGGVNFGGNVIMNIQIQRRWVSIPPASSGGAATEFYTDLITGLTICIAPKASLT